MDSKSPSEQPGLSPAVQAYIDAAKANGFACDGLVDFINAVKQSYQEKCEARGYGWAGVRPPEDYTDFFGYSRPHWAPPVLGALIFARDAEITPESPVGGKQRIIITIKEGSKLQAHFVRTAFQAPAGPIPSHPMPADVQRTMQDIFPEVFGPNYPVPDTRMHVTSSPVVTSDAPGEDGATTSGAPYTVGTSSGRVYRVTPTMDEHGALKAELVRGTADGVNSEEEVTTANRLAKKTVSDLKKALKEEAKEDRRSRRSEAAKRAWVTIRKNKRKASVRR